MSGARPCRGLDRIGPHHGRELQVNRVRERGQCLEHRDDVSRGHTAFKMRVQKAVDAQPDLPGLGVVLGPDKRRLGDFSEKAREHRLLVDRLPGVECPGGIHDQTVVMGVDVDANLKLAAAGGVLVSLRRQMRRKCPRKTLDMQSLRSDLRWPTTSGLR